MIFAFCVENLICTNVHFLQREHSWMKRSAFFVLLFINFGEKCNGFHDDIYAFFYFIRYPSFSARSLTFTFRLIPTYIDLKVKD